MNLVALTAGVVLTAGLWPFDGKQDESPWDDTTIGELQPRDLDLRESSEVPNADALAREQYQKFLALPTTDPALRAEAMRRLADLNVAAGEDLSVDSTADQTHYREAISLYRRLLADNPNFADRDLILYQIARAQEVLGDTDGALASLDEVVSTYPNSRYFAELQFRRGEILFVNKRYREAESAYASVVALGEASSFHEQSLYKHGWSLFKQGLHEQSLDSFLDLLDRRLIRDENPDDVLAGLSRAQRELVDDSFRVLGISFSYMDGADSIDALLDRRGPSPYAHLLYAGLGELYLDKERYSDAAETFAAFVAREPAHLGSPALQMRVIDAYTLGRFPSLVLTAKEDFVRYYGLGAAFWLNRAPLDHPEVVAALKQNLSDLAGYDHARAQANNDTKAYERAADWYRQYLAYFPQDPDSAQRSFLLAEILNELGRFGEATDQFIDAAYAYGPHDRAAEAGYAALLAARQHEAQLAGKLLDSWQARMVEDALHFADSFPEHPQAGPVRTKVAEELFAAGEFEHAVEVAGLVVTMQPPVSTELERTAWRVLGHAYFDLERYAQAEDAYLRVRALPAEDEGQRQAIDERIAASVYRQGEISRDAGELDAAVAQFLRVAEVAPQTEIVPTAIYDAAAMLVSAEEWGRAIPVLQQFRQAYPKHSYADEVTQNLAVALNASGRSEEAAAEFERVASLGSVGGDIHREALWEAAQLYAAAGRAMDEQRVYADIVTRFPNPLAESIEARQRLADLAKQQANSSERRRWLESIVVADASAGTQRSDRSRTLAAQASLELAEPLRDAFNRTSLSIPLKESLVSKKNLMELALSAYGNAAAYGVADVTTAATYEIAELYYRLSQDLMNSQRPAGLSAEELEQYDILLEEQAFPFEEQAIEIFTSNTARSVDGVYDEWVQRSFARLADLMPGRFAKTERSESFVAHLD